MAQALSAPADASAFIAAQLAGALAALGVCHRVFGWLPPTLDAAAADASGLLGDARP